MTKSLTVGLVLCGLGAASAASADVLFDQGPSTGSYGGCWANLTESQNFAEQVTFDEAVTIDGIDIWTCIASPSGSMHVKILSDNGGTPGDYLHEFDTDATSFTPDSGSNKVSFDFEGIPLDPGTYWIGVSGNGWELGQDSVLAPGDGTMAQFSGRVFSFHTGVGDQTFVVRGTAGGGGNPRINVGGSCPGTVTVQYSNFAAATQVGVVFASNTGNVVIPNGPCAGTQLGLGAQNIQLVTTFNSGSGSGQVQGQAGISACGGFLQFVEAGSCRTSNVDQMP